MKRDKFQAGRTNAYLNTRSSCAGVDVEMVTDNLMLVMITVDLSEGRADNAAWVLAHSVDVVAEFLENRFEIPFSFTTVSFTAAWDMVNSRKKNQRKRSAELPPLPAFLGGDAYEPRE